MTSPSERAASAQLAATEAISHLIHIKQHLALYEATGSADALSQALAIVMKLDDTVGGDLFRDIRLAERQVRRA